MPDHRHVPPYSAVYGAFSIVPAALLIVGLVGLHTLHKKQYGRLGTGGFVASVGALGLMGVGLAMDALAIETSFSAVSEIGHTGFFLGFAVLIVGSLVLGFAVWRAKALPWARFTGPALAVAIPPESWR